MRLISANVNGIRAAARRGGMTWLASQAPTVVTMQEVRATSSQTSAALADTPFADWTLVQTHGAPGRAGCAILTPLPLVAVREGLPGVDAPGRWIEADVRVGAGLVTVTSTYVHTGEAHTERQEEKFAFLSAMTARLGELRGRDAVITGDLNIAHTQADLKNWKGNRGKSGFLPDEQAYLTGWFEDGWVDVTRRQFGPVDGPYTWWSWRGKAFDNDSGWRIDYAIHSPSLASRVTSVRIGRAPSYAARWSDHAPLIVDHGQRDSHPVVE